MMKMQMNIESATLLERFEQSTPLLLARWLVTYANGKPDATTAYNTNTIPWVSPKKQLDILTDFQNRGLIRGTSEWSIPKGGGRDTMITVLRPLFVYYSAKENYVGLTRPSELLFEMQVKTMEEVIENESKRTGRNMLRISSEQIPADINPFLIALWLEAGKHLMITGMDPTVRIDGTPTPVIEITMFDSPGTIATSRFSYVLKTCLLTLQNGKTVYLEHGSIADNVIRALYNSPHHLSDKQLVEASKSKSKKTPQEAAKQIVHEIRQRLEVKANDENDIFTNRSGWALKE